MTIYIYFFFFPTLLLIFSLAAEPNPKVSAHPYIWTPFVFEVFSAQRGRNSLGRQQRRSQGHLT